MFKKIYLQRHTQPDVAVKICYGRSDLALRAEFESEDMPRVVEQWATVDTKEIKHIYSSPLQRCHRLAERLYKEVGVDRVVVDERLMELNFGDWEMVSWDEIFERAEGKAWFDDYINCKTPNGESFAQMVVRAESFLNEMEEIEGDVVVVTHSGFMRAAMVVAGMLSLNEAFGVDIKYGELVELEFKYKDE